MSMTRIDLGLAPLVRLGGLALHPPIREIRRDDGVAEVVEPRVMQVLLALAEARGEIVRREDLTERCWEGRIVGEDAINRVLSRLRRVAEGIGAGSFRIETVTRIGYRLVELGRPAPETPAPPLPAQPAAREAPSRPTRRMMLAGGAAAAGGLALAGSGAWWLARRSALPAPAREAMELGLDAFRLMTLESFTSAAAFFHEASTIAPGSAEPWGWLAMTYRWLCFRSHGQDAMLKAQRARDAAGKALRIDPDNGNAQAALATLQPEFRNWTAYDAAIGPIAARHPDDIAVAILYIDLLSDVGRIRAINDLSQRFIARDQGWPSLYADMALSSWCLGRLDDADAAIDRGFQQWPREVGLWFIRQRLLAYSGRAPAAIAMIEDVDQRPTGLPEWDFDLALAESRALLTRSKADIDAAAAFYWAHAPKAVGVTGNAVQFFAAVGRLDDAFAMLDALYFDRGFSVGERFFTEEQGTYSARRNRPTWYFWLPMMAELRADPRTAAIMQGIGMADYWRKSGKGPDFPIAGYARA